MHACMHVCINLPLEKNIYRLNIMNIIINIMINIRKLDTIQYNFKVKNVKKENTPNYSGRDSIKGSS